MKINFKNRETSWVMYLLCLSLLSISTRAFAFDQVRRKQPPQAPKQGQPSPATEFLLPNGAEISLHQYLGKTVVLDFSSVFCKPCIDLLPRMDLLRKKISGGKVEFVTVMCDSLSDFKHWKGSAGKQVDAEFWLDPPRADPSHLAWWKWGYMGYPSVFVIDTQGKVVGGGMLFDSLAPIEQLLLTAGLKVAGVKRDLPPPTVVVRPYPSLSKVELSSIKLRGFANGPEASLRGPALVTFWTSTSPDCDTAIQIARNAAGGRAKFYAVSIYEDFDDANSWANRHRHAHDLYYCTSDSSKLLPSGVPCTVAIDAQGIVVGCADPINPAEVKKIAKLIR